MKQNITFLDCTLRDGGYYNSWDFDPKLTNDYLQSMSAANVDIVEIGFRFLKVGVSNFDLKEYIFCSIFFVLSANSGNFTLFSSVQFFKSEF